MAFEDFLLDEAARRVSLYSLRQRHEPWFLLSFFTLALQPMLGTTTWHRLGLPPRAASLPRNVISSQRLEAVAGDFIPPVGHLFFPSTQTSVKIKGKRKWNHCWQNKTRLMTLIRTYHSPFVVQLLYRDTSTAS